MMIIRCPPGNWSVQKLVTKNPKQAGEGALCNGTLKKNYTEYQEAVYVMHLVMHLSHGKLEKEKSSSHALPALVRSYPGRGFRGP
jgi:hypothetical protein